MSAHPQHPAHIIRSDAEAIAVATRLAERFAVEASVRDRERRLPVAELDEFSASGLWGITIPKAYGGAEVSYVTVAEVIKLIAAADPSLAQIPQNHLGWWISCCKPAARSKTPLLRQGPGRLPFR